jgi:hypothetical protein
MFRFFSRLFVLAAALGIGGVLLSRWVERQNAALVGTGLDDPPADYLAQKVRPGQRTSGDTAPAYDSLSKEELYERAQEAGIKGRSKMKKAELAAAVAQAELGGG